MKKSVECAHSSLPVCLGRFDTADLSIHEGCLQYESIFAKAQFYLVCGAVVKYLINVPSEKLNDLSKKLATLTAYSVGKDLKKYLDSLIYITLLLQIRVFRMARMAGDFSSVRSMDDPDQAVEGDFYKDPLIKVVGRNRQKKSNFEDFKS